ncbi:MULTISPECIES: acetoacetate decarboxylase family protein [Arthrobacter]|uniref:acetoacetate decarboxylase family protein n=1 Tax=Arthrobacter TaxID=1663 RepID=UPI0014043527|nr:MULTISPECIES: acetoacetate decarboxylase family protein [Arthrobacter]MBT8163008.1 acetoacetate decarboxylase family protein [Arthrobacter sp. GN70]
MTISFPNQFETHNRTAEIKFDTPIDFGLLAAPETRYEIASQLISDRAVLTVSSATSTVRPGTEIEYHEVIVKVPVRVGGRDYIYPVVTWVDHEYSLVRGYLLGFNKRFSTQMSGDFSFSSTDMDICFSGGTRQACEPHDRGELLQLPFLVDAHFMIDGDLSRNRLGILDVSEYQLTACGRVVDVESSCTILGHTGQLGDVFETEDTFQLNGVISVEL